MDKTNYSYVKVSAGLIFTLCMMLCVMSCDRIDNPIRYGGSGGKNVPVNQVTNAIVAKTGASAAEVTSLLQEAMITPEVQQAILNNESFAVNVLVPGGSSAAGETITVPVTGGEGKNGANVTINFTNAITGTSESNPLNFTAANASSAGAGATGSGNSDNQLTINMPSGSTGLVITIDLPDTTVTLSTDGTTVYKSVSARTALNTLVVNKGVTIEDLAPLGGKILVMTGAKVNRMVFAPTVYEDKPYYNHNEITIWADGAMGVPIMTREGVDFEDPNNWTTNAVWDNGEWVKFEHLKVIPGNYPCLHLVAYADLEKNLPPYLKTLTIADNAAVQFNSDVWFFNEELGRPEPHPLNWKDLTTEITGEGNNARILYADGVFGSSSYNSFSKISKVKFEPNEIKEPVNWPITIEGLPKYSEDCTFVLGQLRLNDYSKNSTVTLKNCTFNSFKDAGGDFNNFIIETPVNPQDFESINVIFDGCKFDNRMKIKSDLTDSKPKFDSNGNTTSGFEYWKDGQRHFTKYENEARNAVGEGNYWESIEKEEIDYTNVNMNVTIQFKNCLFGNESLTKNHFVNAGDWYNWWKLPQTEGAINNLTVIIGTTPYKLKWIFLEPQNPGDPNGYWDFVPQGQE